MPKRFWDLYGDPALPLSQRQHVRCRIKYCLSRVFACFSGTSGLFDLESLIDLCCFECIQITAV